MSIQGSEIHNLVRTYQRVLNLDHSGPSSSEGAASEQDDRVSISSEARNLQQGLGKVGQSQGATSARR
ncbi:MAG: hypothetical protein EPO61_15745 [Nitrospirae bacterium]|nr:MAG: hypothetical protein EPO61_15745 [Nitrospirota bacterium]